MSKTNKDYCDTPEEYICLPDSNRFPIDSINCAKARANAVLNMLINEFGTNGGEQISADTVANALWSIEGYLDQIEIMINHTYKSMHPLICAKNQL